VCWIAWTFALAALKGKKTSADSNKIAISYTIRVRLPNKEPINSTKSKLFENLTFFLQLLKIMILCSI